MFTRPTGPRTLRLNPFQHGSVGQRVASALSSLGMSVSMLPGPAELTADIGSFGHPISAAALPANVDGTSVGTLNTASGAKRWYVDGFNRTRQAHLVGKLANGRANVIGFQEVDMDVGRTGRGVNTAVDVASHLNPAFKVFANGATPQRVSLDAPAPQGIAERVGVDGTTVYQTSNASVVEARSFGTVDRPGGVDGDTTADAAFGNAFYLSGDEQLVSAYTVSLPGAPAARPDAAWLELLTSLASGDVTASQRAELARLNDAVRVHSPTEPRSALVLRVRGPDGVERTFIDTHLMNGWDPNPGSGPREAVRQAQLAFLGQLVQAEQAAGREVVLLGDMNDTVQAVAGALAPFGLHVVVGGTSGGIGNFDQILATRNVPTRNAAQVRTAFVTDHPHAGYARIPPEDSTTSSSVHTITPT